MDPVLEEIAFFSIAVQRSRGFLIVIVYGIPPR